MSASAKALAEIFENLPEEDRETLFAFAEFLKARAPEPEAAILEPLGLVRPEQESVVAAIKRLKQNYPMVSQKTLLNETSDCMMQHMMQGKPAEDVIDDLEAIFEQKFQQLKGDSA